MNDISQIAGRCCLKAMSVGYTVNELVNSFNLIYFLQEYATKHASQVIVVLKHNLSYNLV